MNGSTTAVRPSSRADRWGAAGLAAALAWVAWRAWVHRAHVVDDAFIGLRYAENLLAGRGFVFNPGELVEGVTNSGWVLVVAAAGWATPLPLVVLAKGLGAACLAAAVVLVTVAHRRLAPEATGAERALLPLLIVAQPEPVYFALAGMETGLAALLLAGFLACTLQEPPRLTLAAVFGGVLFTVRPETALILPGLVALLAVVGGATIERERWRGLMRGALGALALYAALLLAATMARMALYGAALPNTVLAKPGGTAGALLVRLWALIRGTSASAPPPFGGILPLGLGTYGLLVLARRRPVSALFLAAAAGSGLLFSIYAPPDWTLMGRYFAPFLPLAAIPLVRGTFAAARVVPPRGSALGRGLAVAVVLVFVALGLWRTREHLGASALGEYPGYVLAGETLAGPARQLGRELPADAVIAARRIGALAYYSDRRVFDYAFGLTDRRVARRVAARGEPFESPGDPGLAEIWAEVAPGYVLEDRQTLGPPDERPGLWRIHGRPYRLVRRFPLGGGADEWLLLARGADG